MTYRYIDIHSHLTEKRFEDSREDIIRQMQEQDIATISIGVDQSESVASVELASKHKHMYASIGQHPVDNPRESFNESFYQALLEEHKEKIVCIGECGLDYFWPKKSIEQGTSTEHEFEVEKKRQKNLFEQQIDFAVTNDLPLMLHVRSYQDGDAHKDALQILDQKQIQHEGAIRANFHFFTETPEIAQRIITRGFYISFPGVITFADLADTVSVVPLEKIFSETDTPYAAPKPFRGQDATPLMVPEIVKTIALIKNKDTEDVQAQIIKNAETFFGIS